MGYRKTQAKFLETMFTVNRKTCWSVPETGTGPRRILADFRTEQKEMSTMKSWEGPKTRTKT